MASDFTVLGIETSCDETAAAVVRYRAPPEPSSGQQPEGQILSNIVASQIDMHAPYGGVVPEIAARAHLTQLDGIIETAMAEANLDFGALSAVAATAGPGLIGGLLIGLTSGQALAQAIDRPFVPVNHLEGHALTVRLTEPVSFPYLLLLVSGGHCQIVEVTGLGRYALYGATRDDAVGEAFDKAAKLLGLPYPGGPEIERRARRGDATAFPLPRPLLAAGADHAYEFSFSGLKTALRQCAEAAQPLTEAVEADLAASFQAAIIDCLCDRSTNAMARFAARHGGGHDFVVAGGVAANQALRVHLGACAEASGFAFRVAPPALCTDNAAMIGWAGAERLAASLGTTSDRASLGDLGNGIAARARWSLAELTPPIP